MHILIPTGIFHPEAGGPATYLYHFLPELLQRGHSVEVITFSDDTPTEDYPYPVIRIPRTNILHRNWVYYQTVKKRLPDADKVFINSLGLSLPLIHKPSVIKIVGDRAWERCVNRGWVAANEDIDAFQTRRYNPLIEWVKRARSQEARRPDQVIVPSHYLKQMVMGWGVPAERIQVIYNAFEATKTSTSAKLELLNSPTLLVAARLTAWKGVDLLLEAIRAIPNVQLLIAGDGPAMADLQQHTQALGLAERVRFLGKVPHQDLLAYYQAVDYVVLYSGYEGLSHVILEALHAGTPVIASDKGGNPELIKHGINGFLVPYPDVSALRQTIQHALQPDTRATLNTTLDWQAFAWSTLVEKTIHLLEAL